MGLPAEYASRRPHQLSGGELQRVAIARAMAGGPSLVVFDEALGGLDASVQDEIMELLAELKPDHAGWLFISHDLKAVARLCDRVAVLSEGRIVEVMDAARPWAAPRARRAGASSRPPRRRSLGRKR